MRRQRLGHVAQQHRQLGFRHVLARNALLRRGAPDEAAGLALDQVEHQRALRMLARVQSIIARCRAEGQAAVSRIDHSAHMSTRQYARLVDEWVTAVGLRSEDYGTHSLRRTKASIIYKATGNLRAVQILLGHTKIENTVRYLGVDVEDALTLAEGIEV